MPYYFLKHQCPYECIHTTDRAKYASNASVRVFHERAFDTENLPPNNSKAVNVYFTAEPPHLTFTLYKRKNQLLDYFNYSMSYRSKSRVYSPYDAFVKIDGTETPDQIWTEEEVYVFCIFIDCLKLKNLDKVIHKIFSNAFLFGFFK